LVGGEELGLREVDGEKRVCGLMGGGIGGLEGGGRGGVGGGGGGDAGGGGGGGGRR